VQGDVPPKTPIRKTGLKIPKPGNITSRLDSIIRKSTEDKEDVPGNNPDEDDIYAKTVFVKPERSDIKLDPKPEKDIDKPEDDDDDDWI